jgi:hypothetical protein
MLRMKQPWDVHIKATVQKHITAARFAPRLPYNDLILDGFIKQNEQHILFERKLKIVQMRTGFIWQETMGNVKGVENLRSGDESGLDLLGNEDFKHGRFCMELKNSVRTDNYSSKRSNIRKLVKYAQGNPGTLPVYGFINDYTREGTQVMKVDSESGITIMYITGRKLLEWIFGDDHEFVVKLITENVNEQLKSL